MVGVACSLGLTRLLLASFLFGVKTWDPVAFVAVVVLLGVVALLAAYVPSRRASHARGPDGGAEVRMSRKHQEQYWVVAPVS
jgi:hypothetical protein